MLINFRFENVQQQEMRRYGFDLLSKSTRPENSSCGTFACHACIQAKSNANSEIQCTNCKEKHKPANNKTGFSSNKHLRKLVESRFQNVEEFSQKLDDIRQRTGEFKASLKNGLEELKEYCMKLRNKVH